MNIFHKWVAISENSKWKILRCNKCSKEKHIEKFAGGYQPKPSRNDVNA